MAAAQAAERRERPVGTIERHMAHAPASLFAGAGMIISSREEGSIEQNNVGAVQSLAQVAVEAAAPGT